MTIKPVFYIPYKDNLPEMQRLSAFVEQYRQEIADGKMPLYVDGYCSSLSDASANLAVARVRSNQVKGELILHHGMREEYFITHNHAQGGDVVTVSITIPAEPAKEEVAQPTVQPQEEQTAAMTEQASQTSQSEPNREPNREERAVSVTTPTETETRDKSIEPKAQTCNSHISLRANLLHWATLTPDVGIEWQFARRWSVAVDGSWSSWSWNDKNRRYALWEVAPEVRYYLSESNKFYVGAQYKIGAFNYKLSATGKQGDLQGGGITLGYKLPLGKSLALDFNVGAGCLHTDYKTYQVIDGVRVKDGDHSKNAWGVTDLGVTLVWKLN